MNMKSLILEKNRSKHNKYFGADLSIGTVFAEGRSLIAHSKTAPMPSASFGPSGSSKGRYVYINICTKIVTISTNARKMY